VSQYQTVRSFAEELSIKFGKPLEEIRLWMRYNEVSDWYCILQLKMIDSLLNRGSVNLEVFINSF